MLSLQDIVTPTGRALFRQERLDRYVDTATAFLRRNLGRATRPLGPDDLRHATLTCYHHARSLGIQSEADHLRYAALAVLLGLGFESDPLRLPVMMAAGGLTDHGRLTTPLPLSALLAEAEAYLARTQSDLADPLRIAKGIAAMRTAGDDVAGLADLALWFNQLWPARGAGLAAFDHAGSGQILRAAWDTARRHGLAGVDAGSYVLLAPYFGSRFADDPFLPWAGAALSRPSTEPGQRILMLGEAVLAHIHAISGERR